MYMWIDRYVHLCGYAAMHIQYVHISVCVDTYICIYIYIYT